MCCVFVCVCVCVCVVGGGGGGEGGHNKKLRNAENSFGMLETLFTFRVTF